MIIISNNNLKTNNRGTKIFLILMGIQKKKKKTYRDNKLIKE